MTKKKGQQLFTGSFHPIQDDKWHDRASWDSRVPPIEAFTLRELFERRYIVKMQASRIDAENILFNICPLLGRDILKQIIGLLTDEECCIFNMAKEIIKKPKPFRVQCLPWNVEKKSLFIGNTVWECG